MSDTNSYSVDDLIEWIKQTISGRCYACSWPLKPAPSDGCCMFNCSFRPHQHTAEYEPWHTRAMKQEAMRVALVEHASSETSGIRCTHCNGKGTQTQVYDERHGWSDPDVPCETCRGSGRIRTVEQYLKTVPADWHQDSSVRTWFPLLDEEVERLRRTEKAAEENRHE